MVSKAIFLMAGCKRKVGWPYRMANLRIMTEKYFLWIPGLQHHPKQCFFK